MNNRVRITLAAIMVATVAHSLPVKAQQDEKAEKKQKTYSRKYYKGGEKYRAMEAPKYYDRKGRDEDAEESPKMRRREEKYRKVAEGTDATDRHAARESREEEVTSENAKATTKEGGDSGNANATEKYKKARYEEKDGRSRRETRRSARREKWESGEGRNNR